MPIKSLKAVFARPRRHRMVAAGTTGGRTRVARLSKPVKRAVTKIVKSKEETKYWSSQLLLNQTLDGPMHSPAVDMLPLVPKITTGTGDYQRIGKQVIPTKCRVDVALSFPQTNAGVPVPAAQQLADVIYVAMYIVRSRRRRNWEDWAASNDWQLLCDNGQGQSVPFGISISGVPLTTNTSCLQLPIDKSEYVQVKKKIVKLVRNYGDMYGSTGTSANLPSSVWRGSFSYKLPKLTYDDTVPTSGGTPILFPTNNCTILGIGYVQGSNLSDYSVNPDGSPGPANPQQLSVTARVHVWYKDA